MITKIYNAKSKFHVEKLDLKLNSKISRKFKLKNLMINFSNLQKKKKIIFLKKIYLSSFFLLKKVPHKIKTLLLQSYKKKN